MRASLPYAFGSLPMASSAAFRTASGASPTRWRIGRTMPSSWRSSAASRWSGVTSGLLSALATSTAVLTASWVFWVQRLGSNAMWPVYRRLKKSDMGPLKYRGLKEHPPHT